MLKTITLALDATDPQSWTTHEVENVCEFLKTQFPTFPDNGRIYHGDVAVENDVTPTCEAEIDRLLTLDGPFNVVIYPSGPFLIPFLVSLAITAAAYLLAPNPSIPTPVALARNSQAASPNNELSDRTNRARINGRIPDIFGTVKSTPDLIAAPYKVFENNKEVEYAYMCVGRGAYVIDDDDVKDGETRCKNIPGTSIAVYGPYTSPNSGDSPELQIGAPNSAPVLNTKRSNSVNGQVLRPPNSKTLTASMRFVYPDRVQMAYLFGGGDFTESFVDGDSVTISGAVLTSGGGSFVTETVSLDANYQSDIPTNSGVLVISIATTLGQDLLSSLYTVGSFIDIVDISTSQLGFDTTDDLSGTYEIAYVIPNFIPGFDYTSVLLGLVSPELVNAGWLNLAPPPWGHNYKLFEITAANPSFSFNLDGTYTILSVTSFEIVLDDPLSVSADWANLATPIVTPYINNVTITTASSEKWYGPFILEAVDRNAIIANFVAVNGLYKDDGTTQTAVAITVQVEVTPVDNDDLPTGDPQYIPLQLIGSDTFKETIGMTMKVPTGPTGRIAVRAARLTAYDSAFTGTVVDEVRWRDLYSVSPVTQTHFGNVTTLQTVTYATASALAVKERKITVKCQRKIPIRISGSNFSTTLTGSNDIAEIFSAICMDQFIGRRQYAEVDFDNIYDTVDDIEDYFGTDQVREFNYTFDNDNLSFEETIQQVARVMFSVAYRRGNVIKVSFEKETADSTLLFNHRNKIPNTERRNVKFGNGADHDGLEFTYVDPDDDSIISVFLPENTAPANPRKVESIGIRNHLQAYFHAWREWNRIRYQNTTIEFEATQEADLLVRNDRILVADGTRPYTQDGEVTAVVSLELTLSQVVDLTQYASYVIFLQHIDGIAESISITAGSASNKVVLAGAPRLSLVTDPDKVRTTYVIVGNTEQAQTAFLVTEKEPENNMTSTVKAVNYDERYYANDTDYINEIIGINGYGSGGGFTPGTGTGYPANPSLAISREEDGYILLDHPTATPSGYTISGWARRFQDPGHINLITYLQFHDGVSLLEVQIFVSDDGFEIGINGVVEVLNDPAPTNAEWFYWYVTVKSATGGMEIDTGWSYSDGDFTDNLLSLELSNMELTDLTVAHVQLGDPADEMRIDFTQTRQFNVTKTDGGLVVEIMTRISPDVGGGDLFSDNPMQGITDFSDNSGNNNTFTLEPTAMPFGTTTDGPAN